MRDLMTDNPVDWWNVGDLPPNYHERVPKPGVALCLSGGGYRATMFHAGALWRLNDMGWLPKLNRISSVSGGAVAAACLGANWNDLQFDGHGVDHNFENTVIAPLRALTRHTINWHVRVMTAPLIPGRTVANQLAYLLGHHLLGEKRLADLPDEPRFDFNAASLQSGALWRFSKHRTKDWRVGVVPNPDLSLATVVAASAAYPPFLSPLRVRLRPKDFVSESGADLQRDPYTRSAVLTDGGVIDALGIEAVWKMFDTLLVSDAGRALSTPGKPWLNWLCQLIRVTLVENNQVRVLRTRQLIEALLAHQDLLDAGLKEGDLVVRKLSRKGTYWSVRSDIEHYDRPNKLGGLLSCPHEKTLQLARIGTSLRRMPDPDQEKLINWGYAVTDVAMRQHVSPGSVGPDNFPYPAVGVG